MRARLTATQDGTGGYGSVVTDDVQALLRLSEDEDGVPDTWWTLVRQQR
jgi:hypothetical protein